MANTLYQCGTFRLEVEEQGALAVARLKGRLTGADAASFEKALVELASSHQGVVLDLENVRYVPSKMVAALASAAGAASFFAVVVPSGSDQKVFKHVGLEKVLRLFNDEGSARAAFEEASAASPPGAGTQERPGQGTE